MVTAEKDKIIHHFKTGTASGPGTARRLKPKPPQPFTAACRDASGGKWNTAVSKTLYHNLQRVTKQHRFKRCRGIKKSSRGLTRGRTYS
ncbi:hypothetical protein A6M21_01045 [Desulfotomaculum copahuensis]|uniref:Uncharacterized protein n=1 Tax=Desulfotomaculum copahuensis TaxID=1838280 RepID=A0A1B7LBZ7_9FIRM|nr:hypothetical protein A6M21_01045 [Desulfotomaculum copahuensis]